MPDWNGNGDGPTVSWKAYLAIVGAFALLLLFLIVINR